MRQHSHSHAGGKCEHEVAGIGSRHRSPSPAARYAPIPTAEELLALGQTLRNARMAEDGHRNQELPEVRNVLRSARRFPVDTRLFATFSSVNSPFLADLMTLYQAADNDTDTWGESAGDVPMKPIVSCPNPQSSKQVQ
jgi:hypothetical protein